MLSRVDTKVFSIIHPTMCPKQSSKILLNSQTHLFQFKYIILFWSTKDWIMALLPHFVSVTQTYCDTFILTLVSGCALTLVKQLSCVWHKKNWLRANLIDNTSVDAPVMMGSTTHNQDHVNEAYISRPYRSQICRLCIQLSEIVDNQYYLCLMAHENSYLNMIWMSVQFYRSARWHIQLI